MASRMSLLWLVPAALLLLGYTAGGPDPKRAPSSAASPPMPAAVTPAIARSANGIADSAPAAPPAATAPTPAVPAVSSPSPVGAAPLPSPAAGAAASPPAARPIATATTATAAVRSEAARQAQAAFAALPGTGAAVVVLPDGERVEQDAERQVPSASVIKLWVAGAALAEAEAGRLDLAETYTVQPHDVASGTGILNLKENAGRTLSYAELIDTMLVYSDNTATNIIVTRIGGFATVNAYARDNGYPRTLIQRRLGELDPQHDNYTSAADCLRFFQRLHARAIVSAAASERMLASLQKRRRLEDRAYDYVGRDLPGDAAYIHISGLGPAVRNDIGAYTAHGGGTGFMVVLLSGLPDEAAGEAALAHAARRVFDAAP